jgi:hypothetical protein
MTLRPRRAPVTSPIARSSRSWWDTAAADEEDDAYP